MGPQEDYIETVFTCEGDINDPNLQSRLEDFQSRLRELLSTDKRKLILKKVEPWNSVRVTFNIPREAALRLKQLAQQGNVTLRQLGVLAVQIEGDQLISLTIAGRNNSRTQLVFRTADDTVDAPNLSLIDAGGGGNPFGSPGPSNVQSTRKNIADYLRQGASLFDNILLPDGENTPSVTSIPGTRPPNLLGQPSNINADKHFLNNASHTVVSSTSKAPGNDYEHFHPSVEQSSLGADKPPPPPYPEGSAWFNAKGIRGLPPTTSPLLVNLLQNDPSLALAGMNNFINARMLPPNSETSPPQKKKRKPRKPKASTEGEATIHSVPNPVLPPYSMPTSGSSSHVLPVPMVTQALAANTQPSVTFSKSVPSTGEMLYSTSSEDMKGPVLDFHNKILNTGSTCKVNSNEHQLLSQESTVGKIINPYTGHLEPVEHSDSNPAKNSLPFDRLSPQGLKNPGTEQALLSKEKFNHVLSHTKLPSNTISSVPTSSFNNIPGNFSLQHSDSNSLYGSQTKGSESLSVTQSSISSLPTSQNHDLVQSSPRGNLSHKTNVLLDKRIPYRSQTSSDTVSGSTSKGLVRHPMMQDLHSIITESISGGSRTSISTAESMFSSHKHLSKKDHEKIICSENLLNPTKNPAKVLGSCSERGRGIDSEDPNHVRTIHDTHMQNDIGAVSTGCTVEGNSKVYFNDSGVGSSSERSDDTPSDAGDSDFKSANNHVEEFSKSVCQENLIPKHNPQTKPDSHFITVGYAMSNQQQSEKCNSDTPAVDKTLNHQSMTKRNNDLSKVNNDLTDHQVAMMHLFNKNKKKSPKHFLHEDSLSKEHLQLLQKVESMQFLKEGFPPYAQDKPNQHISTSRLMVPRSEHQHSSSVFSNARTPSPRLVNHDGKEISDITLCNKAKHSPGNTPVSEVEALHNDILNSYYNQTNKKQDRKTKSPISGNLTDFISMENILSVNSSLGKHSDSASAQGILKNDILNNIKRQENALSVGDIEGAKLSKSGSFKRRSPASANMNQLPQQFYDPKKLTESVQKLVKPLLPTESASLPHSQRRSPSTVGSKSSTSPQPQKIDAVKETVDSENVINGPHDLESNLSCENVSKTSEVSSRLSKDLSEVGNEVKNLNSSNFNHVLIDKVKSNDLDSSRKSVTKSAVSKPESRNHSSSAQESASSLSATSDTSQQSEKSEAKNILKYSEQKETIINKEKIENHKQNSNGSKVSSVVTVSYVDTVSTPNSDTIKVPINKSDVQVVNSELDKNSEKTLKYKSLSKRQDSLCNTGVDDSVLKVNCDSEKTSPKSSQKSPSLSPVKKNKSEENRPIKLHLSHGVITNPQPNLTNETITVITRTDRKTENSAGEPTVPPLVLKVSRKPAVVESPAEQKQEESQALTMSLRARKASDASETAHNLRPPKPVRQKSVDQEVEQQYKLEDSTKACRQSRRRKVAATENDTNPEPEKKAHLENCVQDVDQKAGKTDEVQADGDPDSVKTGLRARTQNKPDEKVKVSPKEQKQTKSTDEETNVKRNNQNKKSRPSPTATDKVQAKEIREKSPGRLSRTRSGQISPNAEDDSSKRSTRSAKPKTQNVDTQNDATDTLPPASKRRRTTSRDHR